jgi:hypothetical protein
MFSNRVKENKQIIIIQCNTSVVNVHLFILVHYLLSFYYVTGIGLGTGDAVVTSTWPSWTFHETSEKMT